jgi:hypothetical protein
MQGINVPTTVESTYRGPVPGAYSASPLQQISGGAALLGGLSTTPFGKAIGSGLSSLFGSSSDYGNTAQAIQNYGADNVFTTGGGGFIGPLSEIQDPFQ